MKSLAAFVLALACASGAAARVLAVATSDDGDILLTSEVGHCVGGARLAMWVSRDGRERIPGCWRVVRQSITVGFFDGDAAVIPAQALRPASE